MQWNGLNLTSGLFARYIRLRKVWGHQQISVDKLIWGRALGTIGSNLIYPSLLEVYVVGGAIEPSLGVIWSPSKFVVECTQVFTQMSDRLCEMCDQGLYVFPTWECIAEETLVVDQCQWSEWGLSMLSPMWQVIGQLRVIREYIQNCPIDV